MVQTLGTNTSNDIYLDSTGNLALLSGQSAVSNVAQNASLMQLGEAIYQTNLGLPTFETVFNGVPNLAIYEAYLRATLTAVPGVVQVTSITSKVANNTFSYTATIETIYGTTYLNG